MPARLPMPSLPEIEIKNSNIVLKSREVTSELSKTASFQSNQVNVEWNKVNGDMIMEAYKQLEADKAIQAAAKKRQVFSKPYFEKEVTSVNAILKQKVDQFKRQHDRLRIIEN